MHTSLLKHHGMHSHRGRWELGTCGLFTVMIKHDKTWVNERAVSLLTYFLLFDFRYLYLSQSTLAYY